MDWDEFNNRIDRIFNLIEKLLEDVPKERD